MHSSFTFISTAVAMLGYFCPLLSAQTTPQSSGDNTLDRQRDIILGRSSFDAAVDRNSDGKIDVRDMFLYVNGQEVSATFGSAETLIFHSAGSVSLPVFFSKPVPQSTTIKFDLGGNAAPGPASDYTLTYSPTVAAGAKSHQLTINFNPAWQGMGGEKIIRLTISRNPAVIPANGTFSTHILRIRKFDAGEFVGMLTFPSGSGLPSLPVRIGLGSDKSGVCSFQQAGGLLGSQLSFAWDAGVQGFPNFPQNIPIEIPGKDLGRPADPAQSVKASLSIQRMSRPYGAELDAYLEGFPGNDQPALYHATFTFHDLFAAGSRFPQGANPYAVVHKGRLTLQPVTYDSVP